MTLQTMATPTEALRRLYDDKGSGDDYELCVAALERARVVGVLDNWRTRSAGSLTTVGEYRAGGCFCTLAVGFGGKVRAFDGATPDDARAKAAAAIEAGEL